MLFRYIFIRPGQDVIAHLFPFEIPRRGSDDCIRELLLEPSETARVGAERNELDFLVRVDPVAREDQSSQDVRRVAKTRQADFLSGEIFDRFDFLAREHDVRRAGHQTRHQPHREATPTSPQHFDWIVCKYRIMTDEDRFFHVGLGDKQPVKGILVICWQVLQRQDMPEGDRQYLDIVGLLDRKSTRLNSSHER